VGCSKTAMLQVLLIHLLCSFLALQYKTVEVINIVSYQFCKYNMVKNLGKRKHWSTHALHGAATAIGHGVRGALRVRRAYRTARKVIRRVRSRQRGKGGLRRKKTDVIGTFVKCKDWKPKAFGKRSKKAAAFARKVNGVVYSELPRATELYSYAWAVDNNAESPNAAVKWMQFVLDPLQAAAGSNNVGNAQIGIDSYAVNTNPAGIAGILRQENVYQSSTNAATGPTVLSSTFDKEIIGGNPKVWGNREMQWRQNASTMKVQFKNIKSYAMTLEVMLVKPKKSICGSLLKLQTGGWQTDGAVQGFATHPAGWQTTSPNGMTPLELAELGLARVGGTQALHLWTNPMLSLNDSTDFNEFYKVTHKCKVYLPPGGVVEKSVYHGSSRTLRSSHVTENIFDKRTTFMLVKYVPEVQLLEGALATSIGGGIPCGVTENGVKTDLVGTLSYRMSFKQMVSATPLSNVHQYNRQVISNMVVGGQATSVHTKAP